MLIYQVSVLGSPYTFKVQFYSKKKMATLIVIVIKIAIMEFKDWWQLRVMIQAKVKTY